MAWLGRCEPDEAGLRHLEAAARLAQGLSEAERLTVEALLAEHRGDDERLRSLRRALADLAPRDFLAQLQMGVQSFYDHKSQAAILYLNRAAQLRPDFAEPYIYLGYVLALQGNAEAGVAAARKVVTLQPNAPNAHDSLGEVLLLVGRIDEAEASFRRAASLSGDPWMIWVGVAYCRYFKDDFPGAREALARARQGPLGPGARLAVDLVDAWGLLLEGRPEDALAALDAVDREAAARKDELRRAWASFERGEMLLELGRLEPARAQAHDAEARLAKARLSSSEANHLRRSLLLLRAAIGAAAHAPAEVLLSVAALERELAAAPSNFDLRADVHFARGLGDLGAGDARSAVTHLSLCPVTMTRCRANLVRAQALAGDAEAADDTLAFLREHLLRDDVHRGEDPAYLWVRGRSLVKPRPAAGNSPPPPP